ncbi:class I SAM-dependent methyltransferase [Nocardia sp. NPDC048505]|uniref:class I SAM-dependent methyltransferase n=1 Tax=unclassified Nocardia TaxID=2637762 RepID=UPI0033F63034
MSRCAPLYPQARHDLPDEFFALFLDPTRTHSCAYWTQPDHTLEQAQLAKIDLALEKCDLRPGMTLLDIGCGWGSTMLRALDTYDIDVIGLTVSPRQYEYVRAQLARRAPGRRRAEVRLQGWEDFTGRADRIVSIGAFEYFRAERHEAFFEFAHATLPAGGTMLLHTMVMYGLNHLRAHQISLSSADTSFIRFLREAVFPGGRLPQPLGTFPRGVREFAQDAGFAVTRIQPLQAHYAKTLDHWAAALIDHRDRAVALTDTATYDTYLRYLLDGAAHFRSGHLDVMQFTCTKPARAQVFPNATDTVLP